MPTSRGTGGDLDAADGARSRGRRSLPSLLLNARELTAESERLSGYRRG